MSKLKILSFALVGLVLISCGGETRYFNSFESESTHPIPGFGGEYVYDLQSGEGSWFGIDFKAASLKHASS